MYEASHESLRISNEVFAQNNYYGEYYFNLIVGLAIN
jgi:hypothetical protein